MVAAALAGAIGTTLALAGFFAWASGRYYVAVVLLALLGALVAL